VNKLDNFRTLHEGVITKAASNLMAIKFANLFRLQFIDWPAYKTGIIDDKGNLLKKAKTKEEKNSFDMLANIVRKIKKIIVKYAGDSKILNFIIAAYLLKKESYSALNIEEEINEVLTKEEIDKLYNVLMYIVESRKEFIDIKNIIC